MSISFRAATTVAQHRNNSTVMTIAVQYK